VNDLVRFAMVAFFPRVDDLPGLAELGVEGKIAALRRESTLLFWVGLVGAAIFFQLAPILTVRRPWPAILLTEEQLDAHAHRLAGHPVYLVRQIVVLIKLTAGMLWGQSPEIRAFLHLPAYPEDPGTRRLAPVVLAPEPPGVRAPDARLVRLVRREEQLGRGRGAAAAGKVA
jgi:hypothetical protein